MKLTTVKKLFTSLLSILFIMTTLIINTKTADASFDVAEADNGLYTVSFSFSPKDFDGTIENIKLMGEFLFYQSNLIGNTNEAGFNDVDKKYIPAEYKAGMANIGGFYIQDMTYDESEDVYTTTLQLPAGRYNYHFQINAAWGDPAADDSSTSFANSLTEDGTMQGIASFAPNDFGEWVADPKNPPVVDSPTGFQRNSIIEVGTHLDSSWIANSKSSQGSVTYVPYQDVNGDTQYLGVYLPAGYDSTADQPYKLIFASHGGGGNEADWFHQGGINNIMDNLIADKKTDEAILVTMNNANYAFEERGWDFETILDNLLNHIIPFIEKNYNVSTNVEDRAFCGLSMGGITTSYIWMHAPTEFGYFGIFSGACAGGEYFDMSDENITKPDLMVGAGEEDMAVNDTEIGLITFENILHDRNIDHTSYYVPGAHDWNTWPALFTHFAEEVLWSNVSDDTTTAAVSTLPKTGDSTLLPITILLSFVLLSGAGAVIFKKKQLQK